jgi:PAS domain S-box-containing protein
MNSINAIVWRGDPSTYAFTYVSGAAERILGYPVKDWLADPAFWADHMHEDDRQWTLRFCVDNTHALRDHEFEYRMIASDGRVVWLKDIVHLVVREGKPVESVGVMLDVTAQKEAAQYKLRWEQAQEDHKRGLELNEEVVQGLAAAKYALDLHLSNQAGQTIGDTLGKAQRIVSELLAKSSTEGVEAGDLVREATPYA